MSDRPETSSKTTLLDYIKVLVWPILLIVLLIFYGEEIRLRIKYSDIKVLDLEVTGGIQQLEDNLKQQLAMLESAGNSISCETAKTIVETTQKQVNIVKQNLNLLEKGDLKGFDDKQDKLQEAKNYETEGFEALKNNNRTEAVKAFNKAKVTYPTYHNVDELHNLLNQKNMDTLSNGEVKQILEKYSWGMPKETRNNLEKQIKP